MTLLPEVAKKIIIKLLNAEDYRSEIFVIINNEFFNYSLNLLKKMKEKKSTSTNENWYRDNFLNHSLQKDEIAINAGLNMKSISNAYNTTLKEIVIQASNDNYETINQLINELTTIENMNFSLEINDSETNETILLNTFETMLAINNMAVKRAAISGGAWSTAGKRVEKPLMETLCLLYGVDKENYSITYKGTQAQFDGNFEREIDFFLIKDDNHYKCEVKLMGNGNPESADAVIARGSKVFVGDKLSVTNKAQLDTLGVEWVMLREENGFKRFKTVLENLNIPHTDLNENYMENIDTIFEQVFNNN